VTGGSLNAIIYDIKGQGGRVFENVMEKSKGVNRKREKKGKATP